MKTDFRYELLRDLWENGVTTIHGEDMPEELKPE